MTAPADKYDGAPGAGEGSREHNVADDVPGPRRERPEIAPLDRGEVGRLLEAARGRRLEALYVTTLGLGLRRGEVLGLCWSDLDQDHGRLRVRRQLQRSPGGLNLVPLKSRQARRSLDLPATVQAALRALRARQELEREAAGQRWQETETYSHVIPPLRREAAERMDAILSR